MTNTLEIYSDIICPWCFVGKRRFEQALAEIDFADRITVVWRPFQLNPKMPEAGVDRDEYRSKKFGSLERSKQMDEQMKEVGRELGIDFNYAVMKKTPNTLKGHRLIWYALREGKQDNVVEGLFRAYFCEGIDIGNPSALVQIASAAGLDAEATARFLESTDGLEEVQTEEAKGRSLGISGVPAFVSNNRLLFTGAQEPGTIVRALKEEISQQA